MRAKFKLCVLIWPLGCPAGKNITLDGVQLTSDHATMAERSSVRIAKGVQILPCNPKPALTVLNNKGVVLQRLTHAITSATRSSIVIFNAAS